MKIKRIIEIKDWEENQDMFYIYRAIWSDLKETLSTFGSITKKAKDKWTGKYIKGE